MVLFLAGISREGAAKELMRSRCSACKGIAFELEQWLIPPAPKRLYDIEFEESDEFREAKKDDQRDKSQRAEVEGEDKVYGGAYERAWQQLPNRLSEFDTIELMDGLCKKMEEYELMEWMEEKGGAPDCPVCGGALELCYGEELGEAYRCDCGGVGCAGDDSGLRWCCTQCDADVGPACCVDLLLAELEGNGPAAEVAAAVAPGASSVAVADASCVAAAGADSVAAASAGGAAEGAAEGAVVGTALGAADAVAGAVDSAPDCSAMHAADGEDGGCGGSGSGDAMRVDGGSGGSEGAAAGTAARAVVGAAEGAVAGAATGAAEGAAEGAVEGAAEDAAVGAAAGVVAGAVAVDAVVGVAVGATAGATADATAAAALRLRAQ